jgi:hypothetical protein
MGWDGRQPLTLDIIGAKINADEVALRQILSPQKKTAFLAENGSVTSFWHRFPPQVLT